MKKYLLLIFLLIPVIIFSQKIYSIPEFQEISVKQQKTETLNSGYINFFPLPVGDYWEYISDYWEIDGDESFISSQIKEVQKDTLLSNGKTYKKVFTRFCANSAKPMPEYKFLRKDTIGNVYTFFDGNDHLLYDFTKNTLDTMSAPWQGYYWEVRNKYQVIAFGEDTVKAMDMALYDSLNQQSYFITFIEKYGITKYTGYLNRQTDEHLEGKYWGSIIDGFQRKELLVTKSSPDWKTYYPLEVGDKWVYHRINWSFLEATVVVEVLKDTLFEDGFIYKKIQQNVAWFGSNEPDHVSFFYKRMDSTGNVFRFDIYDGDYDGRPELKFSMCVGDTITHFRWPGEIRELYTKTRHFWEVIDDYEYTLYFYEPWSVAAKGQHFAKNIGLVKKTIEGEVDNLLGAYINGVVYGDTTITAIKETVYNPSYINLSQNYPNPFNGATKIKFYIDKQQTVSLNIYDLSGKEVKQLITNQGSAMGGHEVIWNGKNNAGEEVASGIYLYSLILESSTIRTKKLIYLK